MPAFASPFASPFGGMVVGLPSPIVPPGFGPNAPAAEDLGADIACLDDLDPNFSLVSGNTCVAQRLARIYQTPRGSLEYAQGRGKDLREYINAGFVDGQISRAQSDVQLEARQDECVRGATAKVVFSAATQTMAVNITVETADGPFSLTAKVTDLDVTLTRASP